MIIFDALDKLPREQIAFLPTPCYPLLRFADELGGPEIWIKRDDQTGLATGGNKTRKLEYLMGAALEAGADCVITAGSTQSNHARQTAAAARACGLIPHLVLYAPGGQPPDEIQGNVLLDTLMGAQIHWTEEKAPYAGSMARLTAELRVQGMNPYVIPYGGSNEIGMMGYVDAMREAVVQLGEGGVTHVFATSSGGTQAGMLLGSVLTGTAATSRVIGISVDEQAGVLAPRVADLVNRGGALLGFKWEVTSVDPAIEIVDDYLGGGYAVVGEPERHAIRMLAETEGILVDPVYTGRALAGLIDMVERGTIKDDQPVVFWHTGGTISLTAFSDVLLR